MSSTHIGHDDDNSKKVRLDKYGFRIPDKFSTRNIDIFDNEPQREHFLRAADKILEIARDEFKSEDQFLLRFNVLVTATSQLLYQDTCDAIDRHTAGQTPGYGQVLAAADTLLTNLANFCKMLILQRSMFTEYLAGHPQLMKEEEKWVNERFERLTGLKVDGKTNRELARELIRKRELEKNSGGDSGNNGDKSDNDDKGNNRK